MADILIKNMELPTEERIQLSIYSDGTVVNHSTFKVEKNRTTAIELPEPHGELIDRQKAVKRFTKLAEVYDLALKDCDLEKEVYPHYEALMRGKKAVMELAEKLLAECPTVTEASE